MPAGGEEKKKKKSVIRSSNLCSVVVLFLYNSLFILQYSVSGCFLTPASVSQLCILPVIVWSGLSTSLSPLLNLAHVSYLSASCILSSSNTFFSGNSSQFFFFFFLPIFLLLPWAETVKRSVPPLCYLHRRIPDRFFNGFTHLFPDLP